MIIEKQKIEHKFGSYIKSVPETLKDQNVIKLVDNYNKKISKRLTPLHPKVLTNFRDHKSKWKIGDSHLYVSIKVDGQGSFLVYDENAEGEKSYFCNASKHRIFCGLEANSIIEEILSRAGIHKAMIAGELYSAPISKATKKLDFDARAHVYDFVHCINDFKAKNRIGFKVFDIITLEGENWIEKSYKKRYSKIKTLFKDTGRVARVKTQLLKQNQIAEYFEQVVVIGGAEGIVIKNSENYRGYKVKPVHTIDAVIIGVLPGKPGTKIKSDQLDVALMAIRLADGTYQILGRVGGGLSDENRKKLWNKMNFIESDYTGVIKDGRAFKMVKPQHVAVIKYLDIFIETTDGRRKMQNCLKYNARSNNWDFICSSPFVSLISPRFRSENPLHEDKQPEKGKEPDILDVRIDQITKFLEFDNVQSVKKLILPKSEIISKHIYANKEKVKKFVSWKTNKNEVDPRYPKYVVFFTDYSPKRRESLKRSVKVTNNKEQMNEILNGWIFSEMQNSKNNGLKRGWDLYKKEYLNEKKRKGTKKFIATIQKIDNSLKSISIKSNTIFPSPFNSLDHGLTLLKHGEVYEFFQSIMDFNYKEWEVSLSNIKSEKDRRLVSKIKDLFKKFTTKKYQESISNNFLI